MSSVDGKHIDRHATSWAHAHEHGTLPMEMIRPPISPWMKQLKKASCLPVDTCDVRTFMVVAGEARKRQVVGLVGAMVFTRDDVVDLKPEQVERLG